MQHIQLSDQLYQEVQSRAAEAGFANVDAYVAHVLTHELEDEAENFDGFFTPERMALIEEAEAEIARGEFYTWEEAKIELAKRRDEWIRQNPRRRVDISPAANREFDEIWQWNANRYGRSHADAYSRYLEKAIDALETNFDKGGKIGASSDRRYLLVRRKAKGHGHIVVYRIEDERVVVLRVFHTAQDWRSKSLEEIDP